MQRPSPPPAHGGGLLSTDEELSGSRRHSLIGAGASRWQAQRTWMTVAMENRSAGGSEPLKETAGHLLVTAGRTLA